MAQIDGLLQIVSDIDLDMRRIVHDLRPAVLMDLGLTAAMRAYVEEWSQQSGIAADFHGDSGGALPGFVETTIYRIAQEALSNVVRHARARRVSVVLERRAGHLVSVVGDDGIGFDPEAGVAAGVSRLGLIGMRERAMVIGGLCTITSQPGAGTRVLVKVPLDLQQRPASPDERGTE